MADSKLTDDSPILHVVVIGFHHKKGCQVEYSYPPLIAGNPVDSHDVPEKWKHLPSLALPDGAHNYVKDTVYFHLPSRDGSFKTVYGVSCYRQMDAQKLINKTADVTRSTVQKSVCVLSKLPLYGLIKAKLELITHAYFDERDFSKVELLQQTFNNLSQSLTEGMLDGTRVFLGLSAREAVVKFKHKIVVLFKLLLLERKVLFFGAPVENLSSTMLSVLSLFPQMVEFGLEESVVKQSRQLSPTLEQASFGSESDDPDGFLEVRYSGEGEKISDISLKLKNQPIQRSNSVEPQPLTIPRDGVVEAGLEQSKVVQCNNEQSSKAVKNCENEQLKMAAVCEKARLSRSRSRSTSSCDEHAKVHDLTKVHKLKVNKEQGSTDQSQLCDTQEVPDRQPQVEGHKGESSTSGEIVYSKEDSPLQHMNSITHVEAVQSGKTLDSDIIDEFSRELEQDTPEPKPELLSLSVDDKDPLLALRRTDSFEDLDSPESISRIDREDCFSWEDDRVLLSIDHEADAKDDTKGDHPDGVFDRVTSPLQRTTSLDEKSSRGSLSGSEKNSPKGSTSSDKSSSGRSGRHGRHGSPGAKAAALKSKLSSAFGNLHVKGKGKTVNPIELKPMFKEETLIQQDQFGFPLTIFTKGSVCHPYLSLQYHDILHDLNIRSFVIGATNILFKQRRSLMDVVVEIGEGKVDIGDKELQKQLHLTMADLRFADYLVKTVVEDKNDIYLDGTEWEGGDEWIRAQFRLYLQSLMASILNEDPKLLDDFGPMFVQTWRTTQNYKFWYKSDHAGFKDIPPGHPCQGQLNVADLRMRLSHNLQSTEGGKKINAAVVQTGKYVVQTGKAVGGAISNARSALSSWFSGFSGTEKLRTSPSQSTEGLSENHET